MKKLVLKENELDDWGRRTFVSVTGRRYTMVEGVIHTISKDGEPESPVSVDGKKLTLKGVKLCSK